MSVKIETKCASDFDARRPARQLFAGTLRIFAAEALIVPTGILTAAFLSRRFGPAGYGLLMLAGVTVAWVEGNAASALSRPVIKLVGEAEDWGPVASAALRLYLGAGFALAVALCALAGPLAVALGEGVQLADYLRLYALEIPVFCAAQAHRSILVGLGRFRERAWAAAARWIARLLLVVALVWLTGSAVAAIVASIPASCVELALCRARVRPRLFASGAQTARRMGGYAVPLVASALCLSLFGRLDLMLLKAFGGTAAEAGLYVAAQNLALLPSLFAFAFAPTLLSTLGRALRDGDQRGAREVATHAAAAPLLLLPFAAAFAGAAQEIVVLIFGAEFQGAAPVFRLLVFASLALVLVSVTASMMTAAGRPKWTLHAAWPLVLAASLLHPLVIPRAGGVGAALVTTALACVVGFVTLLPACRLWRVRLPARTLLSGVAVGALTYAASALVTAPGPWCVVKLACVCALAFVALLALGEFGPRPVGLARELLGRRRRRGNTAPLEITREA